MINTQEAGVGERVGKGEGGLDLDICPGAPKFLVTPLSTRCSERASNILDCRQAM